MNLKRLWIPLFLAAILVGFVGYRAWRGGRVDLPRGASEEAITAKVPVVRT